MKGTTKSNSLTYFFLLMLISLSARCHKWNSKEEEESAITSIEKQYKKELMKRLSKKTLEITHKSIHKHKTKKPHSSKGRVKHSTKIKNKAKKPHLSKGRVKHLKHLPKSKIIKKRQKIITRNKKPYPGYHTFKLHGNIKDEYYYINIFVGNPPQKQSVIVDIGSDIIAFPCNNCPNCGKHMYPNFITKKSKSATKVKCGHKFMNHRCRKCDDKGNCIFQILYAESDPNTKGLYGKVYTDFITLGLEKADNDDDFTPKKNLKPEKIMFGCTENEPGQFKTQRANGIMGLRSTSNDYKFSPNIMDIFSIKKDVKDDSFSLCHGDVGGFLTLGGFNEHKHIKGEIVQSIEWIQGSNYGINIENFEIEGDKSTDSIKSKNHFFLLDSGTTYVWLPEDVYENFNNEMKKYCKKGKDKCKGHDEDGYSTGCVFYTKETHGTLEDMVNSYPVLHFTLKGENEKTALLKLFPREWMVKYDVEGNEGEYKLCPVFRNGGSSTAYLIGNQFMKHYDFHFDRKNRIVSFVRSKCDEENLKLRSFSEKKGNRILEVVKGGVMSFWMCFGIFGGIFGFVLHRGSKRLVK